MTAIDVVLGKLQRVREGGRGFEALCPAHDDSNPSLGIAEGDGGRVLLTCRRGCATLDVVKATGLSMADLFPPREQPSGVRSSKPGRLTATYEVKDANGAVVALHERYEDGGNKQFLWRLPGRVKHGLEGLPVNGLPLYGSELFGGWPKDAEIVLAEGEKAADALNAAGIPALGTVTGAAGTPSKKALEVLAGREVIVWPDHDQPGRDHMARIAPLLVELGAIVRLFDWREAPEKGDAADLLAERTRRAEHLQLKLQLVEAPLWVPAATLPKEHQNGAARNHVGDIISAADLVAMDLPEPRWAVPGILPEGVFLLAGKGKLGKSWLMLKIALHVAAGTAMWPGMPRPEQGDVLYLALEDGKRRLQDRINKLWGGKVPRRLELTTRWPRSDEGGLEAIVTWLDTHPEARLIVIDVFKHFRPKEVNVRRLYDLDYEAIQPAAELARARGVCIAPVHHCNKLNADDPLDSVSGTTGLVGAADAVGVMRRERGKVEASLFMTGRDIEDMDMTFRFNKDSEPFGWDLIGETEAYRLSIERQALTDLVEAAPGMRPGELAETLDRPRGSVRRLLFNMAHDGQIRVRDGRYYPITANRANTPTTLVTAVPPVPRVRPVRPVRPNSDLFTNSEQNTPSTGSRGSEFVDEDEQNAQKICSLEGRTGANRANSLSEQTAARAEFLALGPKLNWTELQINPGVRLMQGEKYWRRLLPEHLYPAALEAARQLLKDDKETPL